MASRCFGKLVAKVLTNAQFETVSIVPNTYHHQQRDIDPVVHGDDFVAVAEDGQLDHFERVLENSMEIKRIGRVRTRSLKHRKSAQACRPLERRRIHLGGGSKFDREADQRAELVSGGKGALTVRDSDCKLEYSSAKLVQSAAGLEQYIALDRPDIAYSVKTALQQMSKSTKLMQLRVGVCLKNNPRLVWKFPYQQQPKSNDVFVDAVLAARETMLRSTSGAVEYNGRAPIEFASSTQSVRALSTGEAEFYAITKGSAHSLHSQAILKGFGVTVEAVVLSDASAGTGVASRQGCGRLKHLEVKWLWVREKVSEKALRLRKHRRETNTADFATKNLT